MPKGLAPLSTKLTNAEQALLYNFFKNERTNFWPEGTALGNGYILSCNVLKRQRANKKGLEGFRYECFNADCCFDLGKKNSPIYQSLGAFHIENENLITTTPFRPRRIKIHTESTAINEYFKSPDHLHFKPLIKKGRAYYSVARRFFNKNLQSLLDQSILSIEKRLELTKAIARQFKAQVKDQNLIHWDIKPENIIVNLDTIPIEVNFIDYEFSSRENDPTEYKTDAAGTLPFIAPELLFWYCYESKKKRKLKPEVQTSKLDIFGLGRIFYQIWGKEDDTYQSSELLKIYRETGSLEGLFQDVPGIKNVTQENKDIIRELLENMMHRDQKNRPDIDDVIKKLDSLVIEQPHSCCTLL